MERYKQERRRHIDKTLDAWLKGTDRETDLMQSEIGILISLDRSNAVDDETKEELDRVREVIDTIVANRRAANRLVVEAARRELIAAYSKVAMPQPSPEPTLTWEQYQYELDLWWKIEGRRIPKPPYWSPGSHIDTMPVEKHGDPISPDRSLVPVDAGEDVKEEVPHA